MPPPPAKLKGFEALISGGKAGTGGSNGSNVVKTSQDAAPLKLVSNEDMPKFKRLVIEHQKLSKIGLTDLLSHSFENVTKKQVENTLKLVAEKQGKRGVWELKAEAL